MKHTILLDTGTYLQVNDSGFTERRTPRQYKNLAEAEHCLQWGIAMCHTNVKLRTELIAKYHRRKNQRDQDLAAQQAIIQSLENQPYQKVAEQIQRAQRKIDQINNLYPHWAEDELKRDTKFLASARRVLANNPRVVPLASVL